MTLVWLLQVGQVMTIWDRIIHPTGVVTTQLRRASQTALGTYAAYVAHGLLHPALLRPDLTPAERVAPLPGDELVVQPSWITNFAIDIDASPEEVWPWLVQIGYGRAGWYTWFPLDNDGKPSADTIIAAYQALRVGDIVPDGPRAAEGFGQWHVRTLDRPRTMVLESRRNPIDGREVPEGATDSYIHTTWVFALRPTASGSRLQVRVRARLYSGAWSRPAVRAARILFGLGDNVMENTMLAGIRDRAERRKVRSN